MQGIYLIALGGAVLWGMTRLVKSLRQGILCGLLVTSLCREALPLQFVDGIGIALQLGFFGLASIYVLFRGQVHKRYVANPYNILVIGLSMVMIGYIFVSTAEGYGVSKVFILLLKSIIPIFLISSMAPFQREELRVGFYTLIGASVLAALSILTSSTLGEERATTGGVNAISMSRSIGIGMTLLIGFAVVSKKVHLLKLFVGAVLSAGLLSAMAATGSRGPVGAFIAATVILVFAVPVSLRERFVTLGKFGVFIGMAAGGVMYYGLENALRQSAGLQRIVLKMGELGSGTSDQARLRRIWVAIEEFFQSKGLGIGTGEFLHVYPYRSGANREYPHNLFLEVAAEQGLLGLFIVTLALSIVVVKFYRTSTKHKENTFVKITFTLFVYAFFNAMVSGDIPMNSLLWISGSMLWLVCESELRRHKSRRALASF